MDRIDEFLKSLLNKSKEDMGFSQEKEHTCPSEETIACYLDNLLNDTEREKTEGHLARCDDCLQQTIMLHGLKKEINENGYMAVPTEATELAKNIVPESYVKSVINVISEFISNTIRAKRGYRLVSYGSIALIVMLSVGIYSLMITEKPMVPSYDYDIYNTRGGTPTQLDELTGQAKTETSLELSMNIIGQRKDTDGSVSRVAIEEGSILQSKDKFKVQFETSKDAYVYIIIHDSLNKANLLFPDPGIKLSNNVKANTSYTVPTSDHWFWLDENAGIETIYVLASETPLDNIKALLIEMEDVDEPKQKIMEFVKDKASVVRAISFRHIDDNVFKEITVIKHTEKKEIDKEEPGSERLREMIVRGENAIKNILSSTIPNTVNEDRIKTTLNNIKKNLILEESRGVGGITVYRNASPAVVLVVTNEGTGTGSILDKEGHVLTNWHVVQGYANVYVLFKPKKDMELKAESAFIASVLKVDQVTDLALLKIENPPDNLPTLKLGNIDDVEVAQDVHAIGHPGGEIWTYTTGIISQIRPNYEWAYDNKVLHESKVIQTQTPINPGSSGSPLLNDNSEIIGINSFIREGEGLNYAVSVDVIKEFLERENSRLGRKPSTASQITPVSKEPSYYKYDTNGDGIDDLIECDSDGNGIADMYIVDLNQDGRIDHVKLDQNENGKIDTVAYDTNGDGKYDTWAYDTDEDGIMDQWRGK
jgi:Trypsin-like serine proteases, typically periplasmic, contain C-terminal PDZ domain